MMIAARFLATLARIFGRSPRRGVLLMLTALLRRVSRSAATGVRLLLSVGQAFLPVLDQRLGQTDHIVVLAAFPQLIHGHSDARFGQNFQIDVLALQFLQQIQSLLLALWGNVCLE